MKIIFAVLMLMSISASDAFAMSRFSSKDESLPQKTQPKCLGAGENGHVKGSPALSNMACCSGLKERETVENCDKGCKQACGGRVEGEITSFVCLECGDKKCDRRFESPCNCPEDCK